MYTLFHGAKKNVGDFLIRNRARELDPNGRMEISRIHGLIFLFLKSLLLSKKPTFVSFRFFGNKVIQAVLLGCLYISSIWALRFSKSSI